VWRWADGGKLKVRVKEFQKLKKGSGQRNKDTKRQRVGGGKEMEGRYR